MRFSSSKDGSQTATVRRVEGTEAAGTGDGGRVIVDGAPVSMGPDARVTEAGDYRFFAGWRSDPFFFDTQGALNNLQFTGQDFFAEKDICSMTTCWRCPTLPWCREKMGLSMASHAGRCERQMDSGGARRATLAVDLSYGRRGGCL